MFILILALVAPFLLKADKCADYLYNRPDVFSVTGTGFRQVPPTVGTVVLGIQVTDPDPSVALQMANTQLNNAVS